MKHIKILGIGSPFSDDTLGWKVADALTQDLEISPNLHIEKLDRPGIRLIESLKGQSIVVIIDAVQSGNTPGTLHRFNKEDIVHVDAGFSTHQIRILEALQLAHALDELPEEISFYGIEIGPISIDPNHSECINNAIPKLVSLIKHDIKDKI